MKNKEKFNKIVAMLKDEYDGKMSEKDINAYASDLCLSVFDCEFGLDDIIPIIDEYETEANIVGTRWYYVFCGIIDLLENGEKTAERLYNSFMFDMDILDTFLKLYFENDKYISAEKLEKAKEKALEVFDDEVLKFYNITE